MALNSRFNKSNAHVRRARSIVLRKSSAPFPLAEPAPSSSEKTELCAFGAFEEAKGAKTGLQLLVLFEKFTYADEFDAVHHEQLITAAPLRKPNFSIGNDRRSARQLWKCLRAAMVGEKQLKIGLRLP